MKTNIKYELLYQMTPLKPRITLIKIDLNIIFLINLIYEYN